MSAGDDGTLVRGVIGKPARPWIVHPWLMAILPVMSLLSVNLGQAEPSAATRSLIAVLLTATVLWALVRWVVHDGHKAGLIVSLILLAFFAYGHIYDVLEARPVLGISLGRHRYLAPLLLAALGLVIWRILRAGDVRPATRIANLISAAACLPAALALLAFAVQSPQGVSRPEAADPGTCALRLPADGAAPDIYYIILDGYTRDDVLKRVYGYDSGPFLEALEDRGFVIARGSRSNYSFTELSLVSSLNFDYLQDLVDVEALEGNRSRVVGLIDDNRLRRELECIGYQSIAFETGFRWTEWRDADVFIARTQGSLQTMQLFGRVNGFEALLVNSSGLRLLTDASDILPRAIVPDLQGPRWEHYQRVRFLLDRLGQTAEIPGPKLVFAHIVSPHAPFVLDRQGEFVVSNDSFTSMGGGDRQQGKRMAYVGQVEYLNRRILEAVDTILAVSTSDPVIVIQGDHGTSSSGSEDKMAILNALRLPGEAAAAVYPTMTPVNTFRIILNAYLGGSYPPVPDTSYFSSSKANLDFVEVGNSWTPSPAQ